VNIEDVVDLRENIRTFCFKVIGALKPTMPLLLQFRCQYLLSNFIEFFTAHDASNYFYHFANALTEEDQGGKTLNPLFRSTIIMIVYHFLAKMEHESSPEPWQIALDCLKVTPA